MRCAAFLVLLVRRRGPLDGSLSSPPLNAARVAHGSPSACGFEVGSDQAEARTKWKSRRACPERSEWGLRNEPCVTSYPGTYDISLAIFHIAVYSLSNTGGVSGSMSVLKASIVTSARLAANHRIGCVAPDGRGLRTGSPGAVISTRPGIQPDCSHSRLQGLSLGVDSRLRGNDGYCSGGLRPQAADSERLSALPYRAGSERRYSKLHRCASGRDISKKSRNEGGSHDLIDNKRQILGTHDVCENAAVKPLRSFDASIPLDCIRRKVG
jgi:hypothetical protein